MVTAFSFKGYRTKKKKRASLAHTLDVWSSMTEKQWKEYMRRR